MQISVVHKKRNLISLTPLIDVVFILLVFFMLVTSLSRYASVSLNVAQDEEAIDLQQTSSMIDISSEGKIYFDQNEIEISKLKELAEKKFQENSDHIYFIKPAKQTTIQNTILVLDELVPIAPNNISFLHDLTEDSK